MNTSTLARRAWGSGFTLVELLVSMTVLTLLVVMISQLVSSAATTISRSGKHMDSDTDSRLLFNRMAIDLGHMFKRADVDYSTFKQPAGSLASPYGATTITANLQTANNSDSSTGQAGPNDSMAFYSETEGYFSGGGTQPAGSDKAPASLLAYMVDIDPTTKTAKTPAGAPCLRRLGKGLGWDRGSGWTPNSTSTGWGAIALLPLTLTGTPSTGGQWPDLFNLAQGGKADPDYQTVSSQVVRFEYTYLLKPNYTDTSGIYTGKLSITPYFSDQNSMSSKALAHTSINGFQDVAAIVVAVVMLDPASRALVQNPSAYTSLASVFPDAKEVANDQNYNGDIAAAWNAVITGTNFTVSGVPKPALSSLRVYERYFYLNATP